MNKYFNRKSVIYIVISAIIALIVSYFNRPTFLWIINSLTITGCIALLYAVFRWLYIKGDFDLFGYRQTKSGYAEYKRQLLEERKEYTNSLLGAGLILSLIAIILTIFY
ncbi:MAG: DUF3899 domain-containing protein [Anaerorhabdus sp.]